MFSFLRKDFEALLESISDLKKRIVDIGKDMTASCEEGAETFHDNFVHEEGSRQLKMLSQRFRELIKIKENSVVVTVTADNTHVAIGKKVTLKNLRDNSTQEIVIGSYMVLSESTSISYLSPLAQVILGAKKGEIVNGTVCKERVSYLIQEIT
jgi:transcription elongation GreA/GreB family factor